MKNSDRYSSFYTFINNTYYDKHASDYFHQTINSNLSALWNQITGRLNRNALILDLGCGSGRDLHFFSTNGYRSIGLDLSLKLLKLAYTYSHQPVVQADLVNLPFKERSFDAIWSIASLLHVPRNMIISALVGIKQVMKPDAIFISSVKWGDSEAFDTMGRYFVYYREDEWIDIWHKSGFKVDDMQINSETRQKREKYEIIRWLTCITSPQ